MESFSHQPLISVVLPTYNPKPEWLIEAIESVRSQIYPRWELCIVDDASTDPAIQPILKGYSRADARIKVIFRQQNGHICVASNSALEVATGEFIALLDHDDRLAEHALFWVADAINRCPTAGLIYSDEDKISVSDQRMDPFFKCDWNYDLFLSCNFICHLGVYRSSLVREIGGFRSGFEGTQDYDLAFRCVEKLKKQNIVHIPTRNGLHLLRPCVASIFEKTDYPNYEILIIDNGSDDPETITYFNSIRKNERIRVLRDDREFNYSSLNNNGVQEFHGELVGLINNDIEVISSDWLSEMVSIALQPGVGAVGTKTWYPNGTLQQGGIILGISGVPSYVFRGFSKSRLESFWRGTFTQTLSAVAGSCLIIRKAVFTEIGGLDEENLKVAFNDIDFCLRIREAGYRNVYTPHTELYHHESATRGLEDTPEKQARASKEALYLRNRWGDHLLNDPAYNPNLTLDRDDFSYAWPPRLNLLPDANLHLLTGSPKERTRAL
ncbi:MAG: glycosyl transferase family 2 [Candidatus Omnitrophica bacterium CG07_land_8_20_14_0_80_50_8]|nr:MAG: glycosyl transferase family 2 [Candidatus Omnitrophica bacterium CG07_land_8_20_14_0_80_50_8]